MDKLLKEPSELLAFSKKIINVHLLSYVIGFGLVATIPALRDTSSIPSIIFLFIWLGLVLTLPIVNLACLCVSIKQLVSKGKDTYILKNIGINGFYVLLMLFFTVVGYVAIQAGGV